MRLASVVLDIPTQALDAPYTYIVPESDAAYAPVTLFDEVDAAPGTDGEELAVEVGCAVVVPLGSRKVVGFVLDVRDLDESDAPDGVDPARLRPIDAVASKPYFNEEGAACARWIADRYIAPLSACVRLFTPPGAVPKMTRSPYGAWQLVAPETQEADDRWIVPGPAFDDFQPRKNAAKQDAVVSALKSGGEAKVVELTAQVGAVSGAIAALEKKGVVTVEHRRRMRSVGDAGASAAPVRPSASAPKLTDDQARAVELVVQASRRGKGEAVLVDGVTGSGKTEVYLRAIEDVLAHGRTACVLVPEISLTPQTVGRFRRRFGDKVAVIHSRMSPGERYDQWDFIKSGLARVVVGARSALFTPLENVGLYVIDEEHEGSYKQDSAPRYHARDVALWMAARNGAAVVLGSATPSIETLHACAKDPRFHRALLPRRANGRPMPDVQVVDMAKEFGSGSRSMFSLALKRALEEELSAGRKAVLMLNQRGFAKFLLCRECGFVPECPSCSTSLTYHERGAELACHHCGRREPAPGRCPECGSPYLKKFGAGTQRVESELRGLLDEMEGVGPDVPIIRMDADTTSRKGAHQQLLEMFAAADAAVLLGTQMIAKGLDFDDVTLVGVINADTTLHIPDYRASERTFSLVEQVAGRAGRAELPGRVLVQTYEGDSVPIRAAAAYDRAAFLKDELPKRKLLRYPPYAAMANVLVWGKNESEVAAEAEAVQKAVQTSVRDFGGDGWSVLPAVPCVLAKLRNTYRWHVVVRAPAGEDLSRALLPFMRRRRAHPSVSVAVDVDPFDVL
ncbi:primosomal protein N' [Eggerthellaceae bacterium zg-893]|nr:primosomal protein N' [Eggerthellaceae bacterium zg-893]